jgi:hypothetical protein
MAPHQLTQAQFAAVAKVEALVNHGRKWNVTYNGKSGFSDEATAEAAKADVHHAFVNNAVYFNEPGAPDFGEKPSLPTALVMADYGNDSDLVARWNACRASRVETGKVEAVFKATLSRMTLADQQSIFTAQERCWREQANGNAGSQHVADKLFDQVVSAAVGRMLPGDREYVESLCK